jgi:hypothetical protein
MMNPEVKPGDRIICFHMEGELAVPPGTKGTVLKVGRDPFESPDERIIRVSWDNGSTLSLLTSTDYWKLDKQKVEEQVNEPNDYKIFKKNPDFFKYFDWKYLRNFLLLVREAGPVNMFEAGPFLFSGREWIDRYYGEGKEDDEDFQEMLDAADGAKDKMIQGTVDYLQNNKENWDVEDANYWIKKFASQMVAVYVSFPVTKALRPTKED